jgi:hypothetical protein
MMDSQSVTSYIISQRRLLLIGSRNISNLALSTFMRDGAVKRGLLLLTRTSGPADERRLGSIARYPCMFAQREGNMCMLCGRTCAALTSTRSLLSSALMII